MLIFLQVSSGKQPWSEVREDAAIIFQLVKGHKPRRPKSRAMDDLHWTLIQQCLSSMQERPVAEAIMRSIREFLSDRPPSLPLSDLCGSPYSPAEAPLDESMSFPFSKLGGPAEGSTTHVDHASGD